MSNNIDKLLATGKQSFLGYGGDPDVKARTTIPGTSILTSASEYSKIGFNYPTYRIFDPTNQVDKPNIFQVDQTLEFKLDIDIYSLVPQFFLFMKFKNSNTDVTKNKIGRAHV